MSTVLDDWNALAHLGNGIHIRRLAEHVRDNQSGITVPLVLQACKREVKAVGRTVDEDLNKSCTGDDIEHNGTAEQGHPDTRAFPELECFQDDVE